MFIKINSVSPNAADYRSLKMGMIPKSKIFGSGISGIVEKVGEKITKFRLGDHILPDLADFGFGGFAEYCIALEKAIARKRKISLLNKLPRYPWLPPEP